MTFFADLHFHSKYSMATSKEADLENLNKWAKMKGIDLIGTSDFTHPEWFKELKENLEMAEPGLYQLKKEESQEKTKFILSSEVSCVYSKGDKTRKIHIVILAPDFETVDEINTKLGWEGKLESDGRPTLGMDVEQLTKIALNASEDCLVVPAHCLPPDTQLHGNPGTKKIKEFSEGDSVYTHQGELKKVEQVYQRPYEGKIYNIIPYYFKKGLKATPEHPFYGIKSQKYCPTMGCKTICKPICKSSKRERCPHKYFKDYQPQWIPAEKLEQGDILIFPRFTNHTEDVGEIKLSSYLNQKEYDLDEGSIRPPNGTRANLLPNTIKVNEDFCRLIGYYLAEGYTNSRDGVCFCFNEGEKKYIKEVKTLMKEIFNLSSHQVTRRKEKREVELIFYSKPLVSVFHRFFYHDDEKKKAPTKGVPSWILNLPLEKQAEILKGWWRGDKGGTTSRSLMNQMKVLCLRMGIIPSISTVAKEEFNDSEHKLKAENREIKANYDCFYFDNLSFFQDDFGLLQEPCFEEFDTKLDRRHGWIDEKYIYVPIRDIERSDYKGKVYNLEVEDDNSYLGEFATVHNCMTPWFALYGSKSGFDSLEACFGNYSDSIYAVETGLSADPAMLWRIPDTRKRTLISSSDAHSPKKLGREANLFKGNELSYENVIEAIKAGSSAKDNPLKLVKTIEFYPQEGRYHYDGHRKCEVKTHPKKTKEYNNTCPVCGKPLTVGVLNRVEELADRKEGFKPDNAIPFKNLVPLEEIIAEAFEQGTGTKKVMNEYKSLIKKFGGEFEVLLNTTRENLKKVAGPKVAEGIMRVREGEVNIKPGYDGVYGEISVFSEQEQEEIPGQETLF